MTDICVRFQFCFAAALVFAAAGCGFVGTAKPAITGELRQWHKVSFTFAGPKADEEEGTNPFLDYRFSMVFEKDGEKYIVPGFFAADGEAAETSAKKGNRWRAHFMPPSSGKWNWQASFRKGDDIAIDDDADAGEATAFDGATGAITIAPSEKKGRDLRHHGLLKHAGARYWQFVGSGRWFLKGGADSPENLLAYKDFDGTHDTGGRGDDFLHRYKPHEKDWRKGDPTWRGGRGKGLIGALNYLAEQGMNSVYFLTYNIDGGDGRDVWPWRDEKTRTRFDCSKLEQWEIVFEHMTRLGIVPHMVLQEQENDDELSDGKLGRERRLYFRELAARFAHHPGLIWNMGEENSLPRREQIKQAEFLRALDPYDHPIVLHTFPHRRDAVYGGLVGKKSFDGASLQLGGAGETAEATRKWIQASRDAGRPWSVFADEVGPPEIGAAPDGPRSNHHELMRYFLWANLMNGGSGVEWYFGYNFQHDDLRTEDWRSRENLWRLTRLALEFFHDRLPFAEMETYNELLNGSGWCLAKPGEVYAVYRWEENPAVLKTEPGKYRMRIFNPANGKFLDEKEIEAAADGKIKLPAENFDDVVIYIERR